MLTAPPEAELGGSVLFRDSGEPGLGYLDPLEPGPARGERTARWLALDDGRYQLAAEVRFGYDEAAAQAVARLRPDVRLTAMPWQPAPVFAFASVDGQARMVARGQTSGLGAHNAVLNAMVAAKNATNPLIIAAELSCPALLVGTRLAGESRTKEVIPWLQQMSLGPHAPADALLADVLVALLRGLLEQERLALRLEGSALSLNAPAALKEVALLHWARVIADACLRGASLAGPAQAAQLADGDEPDLAFDWRPGTTIIWRAVRRTGVRPPAQAANNPGAAAAPEPGERPLLRAAGAWDAFDFVTVTLGGDEVTLTAQAPEAAAPGGAAAGEQPRAVGALRGHGVSMALPIQRVGDVYRIALPELVERAVLVRADRKLVAQVGPLDIALDHPELAVQLMPRGRALHLAAIDDDRPTISGVYRALLRRSPVAAPYQVTVTPAHGAPVSWAIDIRGERLDIGPEQLPVLGVVAPARPDQRVEIEAAQGATAARATLGRRPVNGDEPVYWVYRPGDGPLWVRTAQAGYTSAWQEVRPDGLIVAPRVRVQRIDLHGAGVALEVEVKSAAGEGEAGCWTIEPDRTTTIAISQDNGSEAFLIRYRPVTESAWSDWRPASGSAMRLEALIQ